MKKLAILLVAILAMAGTANAQTTTVEADTAAVDTVINPAVLLPSTFYGCVLGYNTKDESKKILDTRKMNPVELNGGYAILDAMQGGMKYNVALMEFNSSNVFNSITFMNNGLEKDQALDLMNSLYDMLSAKYIMIKSVVDGLDCYFTSVGGYTCILAVGGNDGSYYVTLSYMDGEANLNSKK